MRPGRYWRFAVATLESLLNRAGDITSLATLIRIGIMAAAASLISCRRPSASVSLLTDLDMLVNILFGAAAAGALRHGPIGKPDGRA